MKLGIILRPPWMAEVRTTAWMQEVEQRREQLPETQEQFFRYSTDAETVWNAFRLGVYARNQGETANGPSLARGPRLDPIGDGVTVFLLAKGVDCESLSTERFPVQAQMQEFVDRGGTILACGTCLKLRQREGTELCPLSTLKDLYELIRDSDRVISL